MRVVWLLAVGLLGACVEPFGATGPVTVRTFGRAVVPGSYVSPAAYRHYMQAQLAALAAHGADAVDELRQAIGADGSSAYLHARLADELLALGHLDEARDEIETALRLDGDFPEAHVIAGRIRYRLGDARAYESHLRQAMALDAGCEEAYVELAQLELERGQWERSAQLWRELARRVPGSAQAHDALGRLAAAAELPQQAEQEWLRALDLDGGRTSTRLALALLLRAEGRPEAVTQLELLVRQAPERRTAELLVRWLVDDGREADAVRRVERLEDVAGDRERRLTIGWMRLQLKQTPVARAIAEDELKREESPEARVLLAAALAAGPKPAEALAQLKRVPASAGEAASALVDGVRILVDLGRAREAAEALQKELTSAGGQARALFVVELARVWERLGELDKARARLKAEIARRPDSEVLVLGAAGFEQRQGRFDEAARLAGELLRRRPASVATLNFIGYLLAERGVKLDEAERWLARAHELQPLDGAVIDSRGWLRFRQGRLDDAARLVERAVRLSPGDAEILAHLGAVQAARGDRAAALQAIKRALAANPDGALRASLEEQLLRVENGRLGSR